MYTLQVSISYALTMIPDWKAALANARRLLKPGGHLCICDFTVHASQWPISRYFWKRLFASDQCVPALPASHM